MQSNMTNEKNKKSMEQILKFIRVLVKFEFQKLLSNNQRYFNIKQ